MKAYRFSGGEVHLDIPDTWTAETEEDGTGVFYSDAEDSGVLRIRARTFSNPNLPVADEHVETLISGMAERMDPERKHELDELEIGGRLVTLVQPFPEDTVPVVVASWIFGRKVPPHAILAVNYNYTIPGQYAATASTIDELETLEKAIREAVYTSDLAGPA